MAPKALANCNPLLLHIPIEAAAIDMFVGQLRQIDSTNGVIAFLQMATPS